jgi:hypothetical protein
MNERISVLSIPGAGEAIDDIRNADRPVLRTSMGEVGTDPGGDQDVCVSVDVDLNDATPYVAVSVVDMNGPKAEGVGDDAIIELGPSDDVRALAAKLLEAADVMDAMTGKASE